MMSIELPAPIAAYLATVNAKDTSKLADCFADDAVVHDEARDYQGLDAIKAWRWETQAKYNYTMEPIDASVDGDTVKVLARLAGDFPGSPVELDYTFVLENDKIASLAID
jgi:ketosteroid isomerase-like protein